jgi:hypothetical protein
MMSPSEYELLEVPQVRGTHIRFPNHRVPRLSSRKALVLLSLINCRISFSFASSNCPFQISTSKVGSTSIATVVSFTIARLRYLISIYNSGRSLLAKVALQYFLRQSASATMLAFPRW